MAQTFMSSRGRQNSERERERSAWSTECLQGYLGLSYRENVLNKNKKSTFGFTVLLDGTQKIPIIFPNGIQIVVQISPCHWVTMMMSGTMFPSEGFWIHSMAPPSIFTSTVTLECCLYFKVPNLLLLLITSKSSPFSNGHINRFTQKYFLYFIAP